MKLYTSKKAFARHARQQSGISFYYKGSVLIWKEKQEKKPSDFKRHSGKESLGLTCKSLKTRTCNPISALLKHMGVDHHNCGPKNG
jgi:hypothetical protein